MKSMTGMEEFQMPGYSSDRKESKAPTLVAAFVCFFFLLAGGFYYFGPRYGLPERYCPLDGLPVAVYALGLTLAFMLPVILILRARVAANYVAHGMNPIVGSLVFWTCMSIMVFFSFFPAVQIVNCALDFSQPTCHETRWIEVRCSSVSVESWRSGREKEVLGITSSLYRQLEENPVIEVCTKKGRLGLEWVRSVRGVHQAVSDQTRAPGTNPRNAAAYNNRGIAYGGKGQLDQAISDLTKALETNPRNAEAYNSRGVAYYSNGQYDQAILDFTSALEINSRFADAYCNRGLAYSKQGKRDEAISNFDKAIEINPRFGSAYYDRGNAYYFKGEYDQAISDYDKALEIDPRFADAYTNRGTAYCYKGQYDQAISDYTKAIELDPTDAAAYYNRGRAYHLKREHDKSLGDVNKAQSLGYQAP